ncbi:MAG TPA: C39 family peptidase [Anaerolineae bacterium]|nr:C39 family peptidase [Anaerolineae bacterium]
MKPMAIKRSSRRHVRRHVALALLALVIPTYWVLSQWPPVAWRLKALEAEVRDALFPHPDMLPTPDQVPQIALMPTATPAATASPLPLRPSQTPEVKASPTARPLEPTAVPSPTASPTPTLPEAATLTGFIHQYQTWNNCGPATLTTALTYYGRTERQADAAKFLKPDWDDKNVSPNVMAAYVEQLGYGVTVRVGGTLDDLKRLIANGLPVIVEKGFEPEPDKGWMGHYLLLSGYDDAQSVFITQDSYLGPDRPASYAEVDKYWRQFNRLFIVPYPLEEAGRLESLLGPEDASAMYEKALATAQAEATANSADAFAWFNVGTNLTALGRYDEATAAFDQSRLAGLPWRMLWYQFAPYEAYHQAGRYEDVIALARATLNVMDDLEESHYWLGMAQLAQGNTDAARREFESALAFNPNFAPAREALEKLP